MLLYPTKHRKYVRNNKILNFTHYSKIFINRSVKGITWPFMFASYERKFPDKPVERRYDELVSALGDNLGAFSVIYPLLRMVHDNCPLTIYALSALIATNALSILAEKNHSRKLNALETTLEKELNK